MLFSTCGREACGGWDLYLKGTELACDKPSLNRYTNEVIQVKRNAPPPSPLPHSPARLRAALGKTALKSGFGTAVAVGMLISASLSAGSARALQIRLIADNDWALYAGTSTSINRLVVQNDIAWPWQNFAQTVDDAYLSESTWWFLVMNTTGQSAAFGSIGSIANIATAPGIQVSNAMQSYLANYNPISVGWDSGESYNASLADVQVALPSLTFGNVITQCGTVCASYLSVSGDNSLQWGELSQTAVLYKIPIPEVDQAQVPAPLPIFGALAAFGTSRKLRKRIKGGTNAVPSTYSL